MRQRLTARSLGALALAALLLVTAATIAASPVHAGRWMRTTCINPDQSGAGSDGWTGFAVGVPSVGSSTKSTCGPGDPMVAVLSMQSSALAGASEVLKYTPPEGSTLAGGTVFVGMAAAGHGSDYQAVGVAEIYTPEHSRDFSNVIAQCAATRVCTTGGRTHVGPVGLPSDRGGNLSLAALCYSPMPWLRCNDGGSHGAWALVTVAWANLLLSTSSLPTGADFSGSLFDTDAHGTAGLAFTAADAGPGVYKVTVSIDGKPVYDETPNSNAARCAPVGIHPPTGALMWAWQQPCPRTQTVDLQIKTTTLRDGPHELEIKVLNAAQDSTTVLRRTITTNNRTTVSTTLTSDKRPVAGSSAPAPVYAVVLDPRTQAFVRGVRRGWTRSGLTLSGTLRNSAGVPAPGVLVTLFARNAGGGRTRAVGRTTTDAAGHFVLKAPRGPSRRLTISYGEQPDPASAQAIKIRQTVRPTVTLNVQPVGGYRLRFTGRVRIRPLGIPPPFVVIQTRRARRKGWQPLALPIRAKPSGAYSIDYTGGREHFGLRYSFRTVVSASSLFATGTSPIRSAVVL